MRRHSPGRAGPGCSTWNPARRPAERVGPTAPAGDVAGRACHRPAGSRLGVSPSRCSRPGAAGPPARPGQRPPCALGRAGRPRRPAIRRRARPSTAASGGRSGLSVLRTVSWRGKHPAGSGTRRRSGLGAFAQVTPGSGSGPTVLAAGANRNHVGVHEPRCLPGSARCRCSRGPRPGGRARRGGASAGGRSSGPARFHVEPARVGSCRCPGSAARRRGLRVGAGTGRPGVVVPPPPPWCATAVGLAGPGRRRRAGRWFPGPRRGVPGVGRRHDRGRIRGGWDRTARVGPTASGPRTAANLGARALLVPRGPGGTDRLACSRRPHGGGHRPTPSAARSLPERGFATRRGARALAWTSRHPHGAGTGSERRGRSSLRWMVGGVPRGTAPRRSPQRRSAVAVARRAPARRAPVRGGPAVRGAAGERLVGGSGSDRGRWALGDRRRRLRGSFRVATPRRPRGATTRGCRNGNRLARDVPRGTDSNPG